MQKIFFCFIVFPFSLLSQSIDVLFLGNSYTYANNTPQMVKDIALSFGDSLEFDSSTLGGATFNVHSTNSTTLNKISSKNWDYIVMQAQSQEPSFSPSQVSTDVYPYAQILIDSIESNSNCTEPIFFYDLGKKVWRSTELSILSSHLYIFRYATKIKRVLFRNDFNS